jgi:regulatory protein YycI of two-component signal transduction system YycFG
LILLLSVSVFVADDEAASVEELLPDELLLSDDEDPQPAKRPPTIVTQSAALTILLNNLFLIKTSFVIQICISFFTNYYEQHVQICQPISSVFVHFHKYHYTNLYMFYSTIKQKRNPFSGFLL